MGNKVSTPEHTPRNSRTSSLPGIVSRPARSSVPRRNTSDDQDSTTAGGFAGEAQRLRQSLTHGISGSAGTIASKLFTFPSRNNSLPPRPPSVAKITVPLSPDSSGSDGYEDDVSSTSSVGSPKRHSSLAARPTMGDVRRIDEASRASITERMRSSSSFTTNRSLGRGSSRARAPSSSESSSGYTSDDDGEHTTPKANDSDEIEVNDWLDEPEDAVHSPKPKSRHSSISSSSTLHGMSMDSLTYQPNVLNTNGTTGRDRVSTTSSNHSLTALASWLSSPDDPDDEMDDDFEAALTPFMLENMPVYEVMKQVQLFRNLSLNQQEQVVRALRPTKFQDNEVIVQQGTRGSRFYMIAKGNAVITKTVDVQGVQQERMITHLHAGHYFGELALIYDDPRTATVRAVGDVELLFLTQEDFQRIGQVHLSLMLQQVPLLARLNARDQDIVLSRLKPANFSAGEYIVRQGDEGDRFYMITRGEAVVTERMFLDETGSPGKRRSPSRSPNRSPTSKDKTYEKELTRLYEGHIFGEMSLIYSEPRTASVKAVSDVKCLYLSKEDFDKCLLSDHFQRFIQEAYVEKATRRAMRLRLQKRAGKTAKDAKASAQATTAAAAANGNSAAVVPPPTPTSPAKATETRTLVKQRLKNGQKVVNKYLIKGDLGKGTYGRVKLCQSEDDNKLYAVKIMHKTFVQRMAGKEDQLQDVLRREVAIMKKLNHRNVVKLVEVIDDPSSQKMYLVQEYVQHNLMDEVKQAKGLNENVARKYMRDLLCGLHYLHFHKVIHRDIKPENILVSAEGVAKIADFGTARMIMNESETLSGAKGTPAFMAPEMFDIDATYMGPAVDVWSLGATLYMMVIGHPPWLAENEIELADKVQRDELKFPKDYERTMEPHLKNLMQRMLTKDPNLRITLNDCFTHDWVTKEGSEPLGLAAQEQDLTVSMDESECAIQNIPEQIDESLSKYLEQAHLLVKTRQQKGEITGLVRTKSGRTLSIGAANEARLPATSTTSMASSTASMASSTGSSAQSRTSTEEVSRVICAWRQHKRVQLMTGHKGLSARSRELLLEQKRMAFSVDRAQVTEIILPATGPSGGPRSRHPSASSVQFQSSHSKMSLSTTTSGASLLSAPSSPRGRDRHQSSPSVMMSSRSNSMEHMPLGKKKSSNRLHDPDSGGMEGFGRTSFTSLAQYVERSNSYFDEGDARSSLSSNSDMSSSLGTMSRHLGSDADLTKRSLSRKKDFLMVTSEVFRDEEGDFQSRKILFQARNDDFSVVSRVPTHTPSGRNLLRVGSSQSKNTSRKSIGTTSSRNSCSNGSLESSSGGKSLKTSSVDPDDFSIDMDDIDVQVVNVEDDEGHDSDSDSEVGSIYSDVEGDVDVDATFDELIGTPDHLDIVADDEELAPMATSAASIVQAYVSSKKRENLKLGIRSGYAEAKGGRSYMEDKSLGIANCSLDTYEESVARAFESLGFFGVYDGHNGDDTARLLHQQLHHRLFSHPDFVFSPMRAINSVCEEFDHEILEEQDLSMTPQRKRTFLYDVTDNHGAHNDEFGEGSEIPCQLQPISFSGAVSVFAILAKWNAANVVMADPSVPTPAELPVMLYIANVGDCRAVLCTANGLAVDITKDHKASNLEEKVRIEESGGYVHNGRLDGILAISRGFGDLAHKQDGHLIVTPDVYEHPVTEDDEFLLLASDGLFDVISSQQAVNFIRRKLRMHGDVQLAAQEMVLKAQAYFAHDNISVIIVAMNQIKA